MRHILLVLFLFLVTACGTAVPTIKPYKLDIQQGNVVTSKMLLQLRPGMTKSQVRYIMGTPLIQDSFHGNRWDYFYQMREAGKVIEQRRVILDFENELLKVVRGDVVPSDAEGAKKSDQVTGSRVVEPTLQATEKGFFDKLKFWKKDEAELAKEAEEDKLAAQKKADEEAKKATAKELEKAVEKTKETEKPAEAMLPVEEKPAISAEQPAIKEVKKLEEKSEEVEKEAPKKSFLDKLKFWKSDEPETKSQVLPPEEVKSLSGVPIIEVPETGAATSK